MLLAAVAILSSVNAVSESKVIGARAVTFPCGLAVDVKIQRKLRTGTVATIGEDDDSSEERVLDAGVTEKLKSVVTTGAKTLATAAKRLADNAKLVTADNQNRVNKLFENLEVGMVTSNLFESAPFKKWAASVAKIYVKNSDEAELAMVSTLTNKFGDKTLANIIEAAKEVDDTYVVARKMEIAQLDYWLQEGKIVDDVFNKRKENPDKVLLAMFKESYKDDKLASILAAAKEVKDTEVMARRLMSAQLDSWKTTGKSGNDVFKLLKLDEEGSKVLENPLLSTWTSYMAKINEDPEPILYATLKAQLNEDELVSAIAAAKKVSTDDIFKFLKLDKEGENLFESPLVGTWVSYVSKLKKDDPEEAIFMVLKKHYEEETLANMLVQAKENPSTQAIAGKLQEELWLSNGKSIDEVFKLVGLKDHGDEIFKSPDFSTWFSYAIKVKKNPGESAFAELEKKFGNLELARMLADPELKKVKASKKIVAELQTIHFKKEMLNGMNPTKLAKILAEHPDTRNGDVLLAFGSFYKRFSAAVKTKVSGHIE
ncbi:unnamed protein product [Phytophthora lilii]|uniref:Unnamed protein product n=1 Tax=Phytophthora lilii TaxID=2077276 RepID=A0A9W6WHA9_9STRA|nr:unnamed protein product [Phytophthora lilii]